MGEQAGDQQAGRQQAKGAATATVADQELVTNGRSSASDLGQVVPDDLLRRAGDKIIQRSQRARENIKQGV